MIKYYIFIICILTFVSCKEDILDENNNPTTQMEVNADSNSVVIINGAEQGKQWLEQTILEYFNDGNIEMESITTKEYAAYKTDAIDVAYESEKMDASTFKKKWETHFDVTKAGIGTGFLIDGQDWGYMTIPKCKLIESKDQVYWFEVVLEDKDFKKIYERKIKVIIDTNQHFLIADVIED